MNQCSVRARLLASTVLVGVAIVASGASPAAAQAPAPAAAEPASEVSAVVITGSRIAQPNATSVSPIQTITAEEFRLQGRTNTIDLLNSLPQVVQLGNVDLSSNSNPLSTPGGVATVDLRGLGPQRTLVLVDGKRLGIGDPNTANTNPAPDINQIPSALIERVDVLTGGASATYGSDAIAGVVNFILKRNFSGVRIDAQYSTYQHSQHNDLFQGLERARNIAVPKDSVWDGLARDATLTFGINDASGKGNITVYASYHKQDPVSFARRDWAACQLNVTITAATTTPRCSGSSNSNIFYDATGTNSNTYMVIGNTFAPNSANNLTARPPGLFNSNPYEYLQHGDTRYMGGYLAHYELNPHLDLYSDFAYMRDKAEIQIAPSGLFQGSGVTPNAGFLVNCNNPFLSAQQQASICTPAQIASGGSADLIIGRRNVEGGARTTRYDHENYRIVVGARGEIAGSWKYDIFGQRYYTSLTQNNVGYQSQARIQNALLVTTGANGQPVCISGGSCVPYNIFREGGVSQAAVDYLSANSMQQGSLTQTTVSGTINGDLGDYGIRSPWAMDGVGLAFGGEYRKERFVFEPDEASLSNDLSGFGGASTPVNAGFSVKEVFAELRAPLIQQKPFFYDTVLEAGYRYSDYTTGVISNTYKIGGQWAPIRDLRFRGSFQRAIRAPNVIELFLPRAVTNTSVVSVDPCSGTAAAPATASAAACLNTGVTAAQYGNGGSTNTVPQCPANQCSTLNGGNPNLRPEKANTYSIGFSYRPAFLTGFSASVDYYHVKLTDQITNIPISVALSNCLATGSSTFCSLVKRAPNGILFGTSVAGAGYISGTFTNIGAAENSGIDFQANYRMGLDRIGLDKYGSLNFDFAGSYLMDSKVTPLPGEHTYDCAGLFGATCQGVFPTWRHNLRVTWNSPWKFQFSANWRHIGSAKLETNTNDETLSNGRNDQFDARLHNVNYIDLTLGYQVRDGISLRAGVNNVFDKDPPLVATTIVGTGAPNAYSTYDFGGRKIFVALSAAF